MEMNEKIINMASDNSDFIDFFDLLHLQSGLLRLKPGQMDGQEPHSLDEIYLVLQGDGFIEIGKKSYVLKKDLFIYIPAKVEHRFYGNTQEIFVIYFFSG